MKALDARQAAHGRHSAPPFVILDGLELIALRRLPDLAFRLFLELVAMDRAGSGRISTTYAVLLSLLDFDQAPGAHAAGKPTFKRIRTALAHLAGVGLVRLDRVANERRGGLFLRVKTREEMSTSRAGMGRGKGRVQQAEKPATARVNGRRRPEEGQGDGHGFQEGSQSPLTPQQSTGSRAAFEFVGGDLNQVPPRGQDIHAAAPRTPPRGDAFAQWPADGTYSTLPATHFTPAGVPVLEPSVEVPGEPINAGKRERARAKLRELADRMRK